MRCHPYALQGMRATDSQGGIHGAEPTFDPALHPAPTSTPAPSVAGYHALMHSATRLEQQNRLTRHKTVSRLFIVGFSN